MHKLIVLVALFVYPAAAFGCDFKLVHLDRYGAGVSMELIASEGQGHSLNDVFSVIELSRDDLHIRVLDSRLSESAELTNWYRIHMRDEYIAAVESAQEEVWLRGSLADAFERAYESTTVYKVIADQLSVRGYSLDRITFEKLSLLSEMITVFEVHVHATRTAEIQP